MAEAPVDRQTDRQTDREDESASTDRLTGGVPAGGDFLPNFRRELPMFGIGP